MHLKTFWYCLKFSEIITVYLWILKLRKKYSNKNIVKKYATTGIWHRKISTWGFYITDFKIPEWIISRKSRIRTITRSTITREHKHRELWFFLLSKGPWEGPQASTLWNWKRLAQASNQVLTWYIWNLTYTQVHPTLGPTCLIEYHEASWNCRILNWSKQVKVTNRLRSKGSTQHPC